MNRLVSSFAHLLLLLAAAAGAQTVPSSGGGGVVLGLVPADSPSEGVIVKKVAADTPAEKAGFCAGDHIWRINGTSVRNKDALRQIVGNCRPGDVLKVNYRRKDMEAVALVVLARRETSEPAPVPASCRVVVPYEIRVQMRQARARIRHQLGALPYRMKPAALMADLQELQTLARSLQVGQPAWMQGSDSEAELEFADAAGRLMLRTRNGKLQLIVSGLDGKEQRCYPLNNREDALALPVKIVQRLQSL